MTLPRRQFESWEFAADLPPRVALSVSRVIGIFLRDVILTPDEVAGLTADLLVTDGAATGQTCLSNWIRANADTIGAHYASELARHYR